MSGHKAVGAGQAMVQRVADWFGSYLFLSDPDVGLVLALWSVGSWCFEQFYSWPYLAVTANVKGAGKTRVLELIQPLARNALLSASPTPAFVLREAKNAGGHFTLLWDEAEAAASDAKSFLSEVLNSGYRRGQVIGRAKGPDETVKYPSYFPKAFALIGDTTGTVRDRSIVLTMERGNATREFDPEVVEGEAARLLMEMQAVLGQGSSSVAAAPPAWLDTRDREIWGSVFGLAQWLGLDGETMARLERFAADNVASKTAPKRRTTSYEDEDKVISDKYAQRALNDLLSVLEAAPANGNKGERSLATAEAVAGMLAIPTAPWRMFRGVGLNAITLAGLVSRFGVKPQSISVGSGRKERRVLQGYKLSNVRASAGGGL